MEQKQTEQYISKTNRRWTMVDTIILLLFLIVFIGTFFRWAYGVVTETDMADSGNNHHIVFEIRPTHGEVMAGLSEKDALFLVEGGDYLGYVCEHSLVLLPETEVAGTGSETTIETTKFVSGRAAMLCRGESQGRDGSILIAGTDRVITPGDEFWVRTEREIFLLYVVEIHDVAG